MVPSHRTELKRSSSIRRSLPAISIAASDMGKAPEKSERRLMLQQLDEHSDLLVQDYHAYHAKWDLQSHKDSASRQKTSSRRSSISSSHNLTEREREISRKSMDIYRKSLQTDISSLISKFEKKISITDSSREHSELAESLMDDHIFLFQPENSTKDAPGSLEKRPTSPSSITSSDHFHAHSNYWKQANNSSSSLFSFNRHHEETPQTTAANTPVLVQTPYNTESPDRPKSPKSPSSIVIPGKTSQLINNFNQLSSNYSNNLSSNSVRSKTGSINSQYFSTLPLPNGKRQQESAHSSVTSLHNVDPSSNQNSDQNKYPSLSNPPVVKPYVSTLESKNLIKFNSRTGPGPTPSERPMRSSSVRVPGKKKIFHRRAKSVEQTNSPATGMVPSKLKFAAPTHSNTRSFATPTPTSTSKPLPKAPSKSSNHLPKQLKSHRRTSSKSLTGAVNQNKTLPPSSTSKKSAFSRITDKLFRRNSKKSKIQISAPIINYSNSTKNGTIMLDDNTSSQPRATLVNKFLPGLSRSGSYVPSRPPPKSPLMRSSSVTNRVKQSLSRPASTQQSYHNYQSNSTVAVPMTPTLENSDYENDILDQYSFQESLPLSPVETDRFAEFTTSAISEVAHDSKYDYNNHDDFQSKEEKDFDIDHIQYTIDNSNFENFINFLEAAFDEDGNMYANGGSGKKKFFFTGSLDKIVE